MYAMAPPHPLGSMVTSHSVKNGMALSLPWGGNTVTSIPSPPAKKLDCAMSHSVVNTSSGTGLCHQVPVFSLPSMQHLLSRIRRSPEYKKHQHKISTFSHCLESIDQASHKQLCSHLTQTFTIGCRWFNSIS